MIAQFHGERGSRRRRAVVVVQVAVVLTLLLGFAALTVDVGALYSARADLQRAADSAALAGASAYTTDEMMRVRTGAGGEESLSLVTSSAGTRVNDFSGRNATFGLATTRAESGDITTGWINLQSASEAIHSNPQPQDYNAVQVILRRESGDGGDSNGPVQLFFAPVLGWVTGETSASAVAVFDDRVAGVTVQAEGTGILPFTIHEDAFLSELSDGGDQYAYNEDFGSISGGADGITEVRLYPYPLSGNDYEEGDGNFGVLNIGTGNQGLDAETAQIRDGVPASDFELEIGTSELMFSDGDGSPISYDITGSPGLEAALKTVLAEKIGEVVGFMLHDDVVLDGANATYTVTQIRYGRVMDVRLTGPPDRRGFYIQPVSYTGSEVRIDPEAPSTGGLVGRIVLAR